MDIKAYIASGIIEQYVMGLCSDAEKAELESLRLAHPELNAAINQYETELEERMMKETVLPSAETDEKILNSLEALQAPVINRGNNQPAISIRRWKLSATAAFILLLGSAYFIYSLSTKTKKLEQELAAQKKQPASLPVEDYNILKTPTITPVAMYGVGIHAICRCTMFWDKKTGKLYIMIHHLPQSSSSKDYQLWAMVDGKAVSVGIIKDEIRGRFIEMQNVPGGATAFSITLENAGGSSTPDPDTYLEGKI